MRIFKDLEMVEHLGSGVPRILESYNEDCFKFSSNFIRMSFPVVEGISLTQPTAMKITGITDSDKNGGQTGGQIGGQIELTKRQKDVLKIIKDDNHISRNSISIKLGINESAVQKHLTTLKNKGALVRIGGTRGYWKINYNE